MLNKLSHTLLKKYIFIFVLWSFLIIAFDEKVNFLCKFVYNCFNIQCIFSISIDNLLLRIVIATVIIILKEYYNASIKKSKSSNFFNVIFKHNLYFRYSILLLFFSLISYNLILGLVCFDIIKVDNRILSFNLILVILFYISFLLAYFTTDLKLIFLHLSEETLVFPKKSKKVYHIFFMDLWEKLYGVIGRIARDNLPTKLPKPDIIKADPRLRPSARILPVNSQGHISNKTIDIKNSTFENGVNYAAGTFILGVAGVSLSVWKLKIEEEAKRELLMNQYIFLSDEDKVSFKLSQVVQGKPIKDLQAHDQLLKDHGLKKK